MFVNLFRYLIGYLKISILGYSPERFLNMCIHHHIEIWELKANGRSYTMYISVKNYRKLRTILKKTHTKIKIEKKVGLPFLLNKYRRRVAFMVGMIASVFVLYGLNLLIWDIEISGNQTYTDEDILHFLNENEINQSMMKSKVDCNEIVEELRIYYSDITWASVHMDGVCLVINIKENQEIIEGREEGEEARDIVANHEGVITSIITRKGIPLVHTGDQVKEGEVLVTGCIPIYNDSDEIINYDYVNADADIRVEYSEIYRNELSLNAIEKVYTGLVKDYFYMKWNNKILDSYKKDEKEYDFEVETKEIPLLSNLQNKYFLAFGLKRIHFYNEVEKKYTKNEIQNLLSQDFSMYCDDLEEKKVDIIQKNVKIAIEEKKAIAAGTLTLQSEKVAFQETERLEVPDMQEEKGIE